ncbi:MAG: hypothetical protein JO235_03650 [Chroococcidiopsidaceae cyanobacterium CP_BM_RX_35]|nr:hypothetical protein [Chroococcidiopsidaceae cyanobacterium CP_BM_RX_35]
MRTRIKRLQRKTICFSKTEERHDLLTSSRHQTSLVRGSSFTHPTYQPSFHLIDRG